MDSGWDLDGTQSYKLVGCPCTSVTPNWCHPFHLKPCKKWWTILFHHFISSLSLILPLSNNDAQACTYRVSWTCSYLDMSDVAAGAGRRPLQWSQEIWNGTSWNPLNSEFQISLPGGLQVLSLPDWLIDQWQAGQTEMQIESVSGWLAHAVAVGQIQFQAGPISLKRNQLQAESIWNATPFVLYYVNSHFM